MEQTPMNRPYIPAGYGAGPQMPQIPPEAAAKMARCELRRANNRISLLLILAEFFVSILSGVFAAVWVVFNFREISSNFQNGAFTLQSLLSANSSVLILLTYLSTFGGMVILLFIGRAMLQQKVFSSWRAPKAGPGLLFAGFALILGAAFVGGIISDLINEIFKQFGINNASPNFNLNGNTAANAVQLAYVCLVGPVLEETLFRGMILQRLRPYGERFAIVASSVLFGVFHMNLVQMFPAMFMGLVLAYLAVKFDSVLPGILIHIFNNSLSMAFMVSGYEKSQTVQAVYGFILAAGFAASLILVYRNRFRLFRSRGEFSPVRHRYAVFFLQSVSFWFLILFFIANCVSLAFASGFLVQKFG